MKIDLKSKPYPSLEEPGHVQSEGHYPCIYISDNEQISEMPEEGMAKVHYKIVGKSSNEREGKKRVSFDLEIRSIEPLGKVKQMPKDKEDPDKIFEKLDKKESYD